MKKPIFLAVVLLVASTAALADITFYSQPWDGGNTNRCDANIPPAAAQAGRFTTTSLFPAGS